MFIATHAIIIVSIPDYTPIVSNSMPLSVQTESHAQVKGVKHMNALPL